MAIKAEKKGDSFIIMCPEKLNEAECAAMELLVKDWVKNEAPLHIFDFRDTKSIEMAFYKTAVLYSQNLKTAQKTLMSINLSPILNQQITDDGIGTAIQPMKSLEEARAKIGLKPKNALNVDFISPFVGSAQLTLKVQASTPSTAMKPYLKKRQQPPYDVGIAGVISLVSDQFNGSIALCFPSDVFIKIYNAMLGESATEITQESEDAAGELLNIIFGQAKAILNNKKGYTIRSAIPTVLSGEKLRVHSLSPDNTIMLPFETPHGIFHIEVSTESIPEPKAN
jgi:chemotaxis protein CheX